MSVSVKITTLYTLIVIVQYYFSSEVQSDAQILWKENCYYNCFNSNHVSTTEISETDKVKYTGKPFKSGIIGAEAC